MLSVLCCVADTQRAPAFPSEPPETVARSVGSGEESGVHVDADWMPAADHYDASAAGVEDPEPGAMEEGSSGGSSRAPPPRGGGYGTADDRDRDPAAAREEWTRGEPESAVGRACRVAEPVVFWTLCTAFAAYGCVNMVRVTTLPHYPTTMPEAYDQRSTQVGYVANSTEAAGAFRGCTSGSDSAYLRDDIGDTRFPDFIIAGGYGAPTDELRRLMVSKKLGCAGLDPKDAFFADARWRDRAIPLESQKTFIGSQYAWCSTTDGYLGVPRFHSSSEALYAGWSPRRMCETMGASETRVVTVLPNPVDHTMYAFARVLEKHKEGIRRWAERADAGRGRGVTAAVGANDGAETPRAPEIAYDDRGLAEVVRVDLAIARACGPDVLLAGDDPRLESSRACCARTARSVGYAAWPGCRSCNPGLDKTAAAACAAFGEAGFSPVRLGVYAHLLKRIYAYVPSRNVLVLTSDQARASGMPTLATAILEWQLLRLPLVDPSSVASNLFSADAKARMGRDTRSGKWTDEGDRGGLTLPRVHGSVDGGGGSGVFSMIKRAVSSLRAGVFGGGAGSGSNDGDSGLGQGVYFPPIKLPKPLTSAAISGSMRRGLQEFYTPHVEALNKLMGNGRIRWWKADGSPVFAMQKPTISMDQEKKPDMDGVVDAANFGPSSAFGGGWKDASS